jgi:hypothetical protein
MMPGGPAVVEQLIDEQPTQPGDDETPDKHSKTPHGDLLLSGFLPYAILQESAAPRRMPAYRQIGAAALRSRPASLIIVAPAQCRPGRR